MFTLKLIVENNLVGRGVIPIIFLQCYQKNRYSVVWTLQLTIISICTYLLTYRATGAHYRKSTVSMLKGGRNQLLVTVNNQTTQVAAVKYEINSANNNK